MTCDTGIYLITHLESGRPYVGLTGVGFATRWSEHRKRLNAGTATGYPKLQRAWAKYGEEAFAFSIHTVIPQGELSPDEFYRLLRAEEVRVLAQYPKHLNSMEAGVSGMRWTEEAREKLRAKATGRKHSEETRRKISENTKNLYKNSPQFRERQSASRKGKKLSPEHAAALRASNLGRKSPGRKLSPEHIEALRAANIGNKRGLGRKQSAESHAKRSASLKAYHAARRAKLAAEGPATH